MNNSAVEGLYQQEMRFSTQAIVHQFEMNMKEFESSFFYFKS
jgi:hypothetical protein